MHQIEAGNRLKFLSQAPHRRTSDVGCAEGARPPRRSRAGIITLSATDLSLLEFGWRACSRASLRLPNRSARALYVMATPGEAPNTAALDAATTRASGIAPDQAR